MALLQDLYPSRQDEKAELLERHDPVVYRDDYENAPVSAELISQYEKDGFLILPEVFSSDEVGHLRSVLQEMASDEEIRAKNETVIEPGSGEVRSIFRIHQLHDELKQLCRDPRLLRIARFILNDDVYIHQSRANMKPGYRGKEFYWHSDFETWHTEDGMPRMRCLSMSISLTNNTEYNGPLMLIPGSQNHYVSCIGETPDNHYKASLKRQEFGVPDDNSMTQLYEEGGIVTAKGKAGSVIIFDCNTMHGSNSNISPLPRSNAFFVYNSISNRLVEPFSASAPRPEFIASRDTIEAL